MSWQKRSVAQRWGDASAVGETARLHWMASPVVQGYVNQRVTGDPLYDWLTWSRDHWLGATENRVLVLGCGEGWVERALAADPRVAFIDACDIAEEAVARAAARARQEALESIRYSVVDLDRDPLPGEKYDLVVAHAALHHVTHLEDLYERLQYVMKPDAHLLANEYVGPRRLQFPPDQMKHIARTFALLPRRFRISGTTGEELLGKNRPDEAEVMAADPSESVRSDEVLQLLAQRFRVVERRDFGGALLQHLLWDIVPNFDPHDPRDNRVLALLCLLEETLEQHQELASDFTLVVAKNQQPERDSPLRPSPGRKARAVPIWLLPGYLVGAEVGTNSAPDSEEDDPSLDSQIEALLLGAPVSHRTTSLHQALEKARPPLDVDRDPRDHCALALVREITGLHRR